MSPEIDVGRRVAGKYELVRLIGRGAMGEVWLATHDSLGGEFAIKLVKHREDDEDASAAGRFQLEAQISAKLSRKTRHIVSVSDHGEEDGLAYLVMERLEGESLAERIDRTGELSLEETVAIVVQVARALGQAHAEGIFHRDLKPANLFLTKDEDGRLLVKVLDFGIARSAKPFRTRSPVATAKDMVLGTPSYMSPEQARGLATLDHRCDLWALSVVAYESLTRGIPWEGETVEDIFLSICTHRAAPILERRPDLPHAIHGVFLRSFAPKLDDRFCTSAELSGAFEALVDPLAVEAAMGAAPPTSHALGTDPNGIVVGEPTVLVRRSRRSSGWLLAAGVALVTIGLILVGLRTFTSRGAPETTPLRTPPPSTVPTSLVVPPGDRVAPPSAATTAPPVEVATSARAPAHPLVPPRGPTRSPALAPNAPVTTVAPVATTPPPARSVPDKSGVF